MGLLPFKRDGADVLAPVLSDGAAFYTPGVSELRGSQARFFHPDRLGSFPQVTNAYPGSIAKREYDAFGVKVRDVQGSTPAPWGFAGEWGYHEDAETGVVQVGHRYYDPSLGRFLTRDPIGDGRNWYVYCDNNPSLWIDPEGLQLSLSDPARAGTYGYPRELGGLGSIWDKPDKSLHGLPMKLYDPEDFLPGLPLMAGMANGRGFKQGRLRQLSQNGLVPSFLRGWLKQEINRQNRMRQNGNNQANLRVPPGYVLAHERGKEAKKGYNYRYSNLNTIDLHKIQHKKEAELSKRKKGGR